MHWPPLAGSKLHFKHPKKPSNQQLFLVLRSPQNNGSPQKYALTLPKGAFLRALSNTTGPTKKKKRKPAHLVSLFLCDLIRNRFWIVWIWKRQDLALLGRFQVFLLMGPQKQTPGRNRSKRKLLWIPFQTSKITFYILLTDRNWTSQDSMT